MPLFLIKKCPCFNDKLHGDPSGAVNESGSNGRGMERDRQDLIGHCNAFNFYSGMGNCEGFEKRSDMT